MNKFECHITFDKADREKVLEASPQDWVFSEIDGDPLMEQKPYVYLTKFDTDSRRLLNDAIDVELWMLSGYSVQALRVKIERIIYDTKTDVDEISYFPFPRER